MTPRRRTAGWRSFLVVAACVFAVDLALLLAVGYHEVVNGVVGGFVGVLVARLLTRPRRDKRAEQEA
jgi:hypothetical protein